MNLDSLVSAMLTRQAETEQINHLYDSKINEDDGGFHIHNDGNIAGHLTANSLKVAPISIFVADCDYEERDLYCQDNVITEGFDLRAALANASPAWKLMEIVVQSDGLIVLAFMNVLPTEYAVDPDGIISSTSWETVTLNADLQRLTMLVETEDGRCQFIIQQQYVETGNCVVTTVTEVRNGLKTFQINTEGALDDDGSPRWYGVTYRQSGDKPLDSSPRHHTDQPGA